ncbi:MAG: hypothetical protein QXX99_02145 [Candidatus Bathyarchaeia archaeon]
MNSDEYTPLCEKCGQPIDNYRCVCPYCCEASGCGCCIGADKATGG